MGHAVAAVAAIACLGALGRRVLMHGQAPMAVANVEVFPRLSAQADARGTPVRDLLVGIGIEALA